MSFVQRLPLVRSALEKVMRGRRVWRTLANGVGLYVSPDSQLKYLRREFDGDLADIARRFVTKDAVVWDIGANCGVFAFNSAAARELVAVEADPFLCNLMQDSMARNGRNVTVICAAISGTNGLESFSVAQRGRASSHLTARSGRSQTGGERARYLVPTFTLDRLTEYLASPTIVKIDVEGAEVEALRGASNLLMQARPIIYLETSEYTHDDCAEILKKAGYEMEKGAEMNWLCRPL